MRKPRGRLYFNGRYGPIVAVHEVDKGIAPSIMRFYRVRQSVARGYKARSDMTWLECLRAGSWFLRG